jgi:tRNA(Ile)-lysidine synthase
VTGLLDRVAAVGQAHALLDKGPVAVAVSGGIDSLALLHVLAELDRVPLVVVSVDHGLRLAAAQEVAGVAAVAEALGLPFRSAALNVAAGPGLQARAREARYAWFDALPEPTVALGHHLDDQAETVLDRLARGSGSRGLAAMQPRRGRYVRPLLGVRRAELESWLWSRGVDGVHDPSNAKGTRGALRQDVLPALERVRPGAALALARSARLLAEDDALLQALAAPLVGTDGVEVAPWRAAAGALRRRALLALAPSLTARQIDDVLALTRPGSWVETTGASRLALDGAWLRLLPPPPEPTELRSGDWGLWQVAADVPVQVRSPKPGEDAGGTPLRERLRQAGVGPALRPYHPVVVREGRRWVPGVWREQGTGHPTVRVVIRRPAAVSVPAGGPFEAAL